MDGTSPPGELEALRRLMQAGDAAALDRLARAYGPRLLAVAKRCCRFAHDAEDAVQQALVSAAGSMSGYRGEGSPVAWLSTLVARSCFRLNRDPHNDPARTCHDQPEPCACENPEERAAHKQLEDRVGAALMTLPRTDRLAFLLAAEGWSSAEIAAHFALTSDAVRSRLKRARKILRAQLAPQIDRPGTHNEEPTNPETP